MELKEYCNPHGKKTELARSIGVDGQLIWQWATGVREVPLERCQQIEQATAGQVTCEEMRPDKVEYFAYMRTRAAPEMAGVAVAITGDAMGYTDLAK